MGLIYGRYLQFRILWRPNTGIALPDALTETHVISVPIVTKDFFSMIGWLVVSSMNFIFYNIWRFYLVGGLEPEFYFSIDW